MRLSRDLPKDLPKDWPKDIAVAIRERISGVCPSHVDALTATNHRSQGELPMPLDVAETRAERKLWAPSRGVVLKLVSSASGYPVEALCGQGRDHDLCRARHVGFWLMRRYGYAMSEVGHAFGGRDHSTVVYGVRRVDIAIATGDPSFADVLCDVLTAAIASGTSGLPELKPRPATKAAPTKAAATECTARPVAAKPGSTTASHSAKHEPAKGCVPGLPFEIVERARRMRRAHATLKGTAKALGVDPLALAIALGERIRNDMSPAHSHSNTEKVLV